MPGAGPLALVVERDSQALMTRDQPPPTADCAHPVDRNVALAERLGVTGTPTLVAADGRVLPGAASAEQIPAWLSRSTASADSPAAQATGKAPCRTCAGCSPSS